MGFVLEPDEAQAWIEADPRNAEVLFPYLNGEDLNSRPDASASRWVIDFNERSEDEAQRVSTFRTSGCWSVSSLSGSEEANSTSARTHRWWQFCRDAPRHCGRRSRDLDEVLVIAQVSKTVMPVRVPTGQVFSHKLVVFATDSYR